MTVLAFKKMMGLILTLLFWFIFTTPLHEMFHYAAAFAVGIRGGNVTFVFGGGFYNYPDGVLVTTFQRTIVSMAGGIGTALFLALVWTYNSWVLKFSLWELNNTVSVFVVATTQFIYAFFDGHGMVLVNIGELAGFLIAVMLAYVVYGKTLVPWFNSEEMSRSDQGDGIDPARSDNSGNRGIPSAVLPSAQRYYRRTHLYNLLRINSRSDAQLPLVSKASQETDIGHK